jgi:predicted Zn-dependent protease
MVRSLCKGMTALSLNVGPLSMDRIATFRSFIGRNPADPFPRYGLAMEHKSRGELAAAWTTFAELIEQFPDYVPTYLMAGDTLVGLSRKDDAAGVYRKGIEVATRCGDPHARGELEGALLSIAGPDAAHPGA